MLKISFFFKKPNDNEEKLELITISSPKKILEGKLAGNYACEVYLPDTERSFPICSANPIDAVCNASESVKVYLQSLIARGFVISEPETHEPLKLEKKSPQLILQEKIEAIKNSRDISSEDKQKILKSFKEI